MESISNDGERYVPSVSGAIRYEHLQRYHFAARLACGRRALDIASGEGYGSNILAAKAASVVGIDCDAQCVEHASLKYIRDNLKFARGDLNCIPIEDSSFDMVVSFESIEHVARPIAALLELKRVLNPNGLLIVSTPDKRYYPKGNTHHLHELEGGEFLDALRANFRYVKAFGQRAVAGVMLYPVDALGAGQCGIWTDAGDVGRLSYGGVEYPIYIVAICSNVPLPDAEYGLIENPAESARVWNVYSFEYPALQARLRIWSRFKCSVVGRVVSPFLSFVARILYKTS